MAEIPDLFPQVEAADLVEDFDPDDDVGLIDTEVEEPVPYGFTWGFDFNKGDLDFSAGNPPKHSEQGVVKEWIYHTINTEQYETPIFGPDIGTNIFTLIGSVLDNYTVTQVSAEIESAISVHDRITDVIYITAFAVTNNVYTYFAYETDDGLVDQQLQQLR